VYYPDLLSAIRGTLSPRRLNLVHQVFDALDTNNHGAVDCELIVRSYDASKHPQVLSGEKKAADVAREFSLAFDGAGALNNGAVTREEFVKFYSGVSASIPYDDDFFATIIQRCWGIKEHVPAWLASTILAPGRSGSAAAAAAQSTTPLLARVRHIFREKVRQKTINTKSEVENLRLVFKYFDLSNSGTVNFNQFKQAVQRFGIYLDDNTLAALFDEFDTEGSGRIDYLRFAVALYEEETTSAAHHQFNRSQQFKALAEQRIAEERQARPLSRQYVDAKEVIISSPTGASAASQQQQQQQGGFTGAPRAVARKTLSQKERENSVLPTVVFVLGGSGAGKRTQCARVVREFGFVHLRVSELLDGERANPGSALGAALNSAPAGSQPPADLLVSLIDRTIQDNVLRGNLYFLVDGFPSTLAERKTWEAHFGGSGSKKVDVPFAIYLEAPQAVLEARLVARAKNTGRPLDRPEVLARRFASFAREGIAVVNSFGQEGRLQVVDAAQMPDEVYAQVRAIVAEL
jgi:UMP-CMP kinase